MNIDVCRSAGIRPARIRHFIAVLISALVSVSCSKPTQTVAAQQPPPPPIEYVDTWGSHGDGPGQFDKPIAMASDGESIIYITDAATGFVHKFSPSGEPRLSFQDDRTNMHPADLAVDAGAAIYVADAHRGTVAIFFSDGMRHRELRTGAPAPVRDSMHIAVDSYGTIYVTARQPYGIRKFSPSLRLIGSWGGASAKAVDPPVKNPTASVVGPDGLLYISERGNPEVKVFDTNNGTLLRSAVVATDTDVYLTGIAVNRKFIFAVGASYPQIYVWSLAGEDLYTLDLSNWVPGVGAMVIRKIVVTPANDLLLLDTAAARVFRFRLHLQ